MPVEKRKIPKSDKAKRSLYMSAQPVKNLPKRKRIEWEGDKTPSGSGESYAYAQSGKAVMGKKKKAIRTKYGDDVDVDIDKRMSFPDKKGGSDTYRRKVRGKYRSVGGSKDTKSTIETTHTKQTRGGKVLKKEYMPETEESKRAIMKEVQEEVERPKKKKVVKNEPVKNKKKGWRLPTAKEKEESKKTIKHWKNSKKGSGYVPEKQQAKKETDDTVQEQIKSGFGDMLTPSKITARGEAARKRIEAKGASARKRIESKGDDARKRIEERAKAARKRILGN